MKKRHIDGLNIKPGPAVSGDQMGNPVGGEIIPINKLSLLLSQYWLLLIILLIPFAFLLYTKRGIALKLFSPIVSRLFRSKWI